jgi:hypothetical protein
MLVMDFDHRKFAEAFEHLPTRTHHLLGDRLQGQLSDCLNVVLTFFHLSSSNSLGRAASLSNDGVRQSS